MVNLLAGEGKELRFAPKNACQEYATWEELQKHNPALPIAAAFFDQKPAPPFGALYLYLPTPQEGRVRIMATYLAAQFSTFYPLPSEEEEVMKGILEFK